MSSISHGCIIFYSLSAHDQDIHMPRLYSIYYIIIIEFLYTSFSVYISKGQGGCTSSSILMLEKWLWQWTQCIGQQLPQIGLYLKIMHGIVPLPAGWGQGSLTGVTGREYNQTMQGVHIMYIAFSHTNLVRFP